MITLLNSPRLTDYGTYEFSPLTIEEARRLIAEGFRSAIGHQGTAEFLTDLFGAPVAMTREDYRQQSGECAVVLLLNVRLPEGRIIDRDEIERIGYRFGLLRRVE